MRPITRTSGMNRTEAAYAMQLEALKQAGEVRDYLYEAVTLKLANDTRYTPDFFVVYPDRFECHEVKGFWRDDAKVKIKVAAQRFPWMRFLAIQWVKKEWKIEEF